VADTEYTRRTLVVRLEADRSIREQLTDTVVEWKRGYQLAVERAWGVCYTRSDVQQLAYDEVRARTDLGSQHAVLATHQAAEAIKEYVDAPGDDWPARPEFSTPPVSYDTRTMTLFEDGAVSLTTTGRRVRCRLSLPSESPSYPERYLESDEWESAKSTLRYRDGDFYLYVGFRKPKPAVEPPSDDATVLGVNLGVETLAVTSTARFFPIGELNHRWREFTDRREGLVETDTRSARRTLTEARARFDRHARNRLHVVANGVVAEATAYQCDVVAFGDLDAVVETLPTATEFTEWAFETLYEFVSYKAAERGVAVVQVNPEYTTQRCTECGFTHPQNRDLERNHFTCLKCGHQQHDGYNAAKNVAFRCIRRGPLSSSGVGATYCALQSGRVTPDGELVPHPKTVSADAGRNG